MADKPQSNDMKPGTTAAGTPAPLASRAMIGGTAGSLGGGAPVGQVAHRGADMRDAMAEMAERAQLISQEAGSKIAAAMKDVIGAAAGIAGFAVESARDLVQYMVRRGQMTQDEADRLIRDAEEAHGKRAAGERSRGGARPAVDRLAMVKGGAASREHTAREHAAREATRESAAARVNHSGVTPVPHAPAKSPPAPARNVTAKKPAAAAASAPTKSAKKDTAKRSSTQKKPTAKKPVAKKKR